MLQILKIAFTGIIVLLKLVVDRSTKIPTNKLTDGQKNGLSEVSTIFWCYEIIFLESQAASVFFM